MKLPKYPQQAREMEEILKRTGFTLEELARKTGIHPRTLANTAGGHTKLSDFKMNIIREVGSVPLLGSDSLKNTGVDYGDPIRRLRLIPVVSSAQAGTATVYEDLPSQWMKRIPSDSSDPQAFGIEIEGDSMEPEYRHGQIAIVIPNSEWNSGDLVVANIKKDGVVLKLIHRQKGSAVRLTSYNPAYPSNDYSEKDFHWIYVVDHVLKPVRRK
jgi:phage repressor protein C with HTH and peptisase S24 domain